MRCRGLYIEKTYSAPSMKKKKQSSHGKYIACVCVWLITLVSTLGNKMNKGMSAKIVYTKQVSN